MTPSEKVMLALNIVVLILLVIYYTWPNIKIWRKNK